MRISALCILMLCAGVLLAQTPTFSNLDYVGRGNVKQMLDLYIPQGLTTRAPLIIFIHGGGWQSGSKGGAMGFCDTLFRRGFVVADINYRLSGDSIFPAQIFDCKAAIRWLKSHAAQYNIDTCRVAVTGSSAGGHLASLVGTSGSVDSLEDLGLGSRNATSKVHAVIPFYGPSDFLQMDAHIPRTPPDSCTTSQIHNSPNSPETKLLGCQISVCTERVRKANPMTYIDVNDPPFKLYHGTFDCTVPPHQSVLMDSALRAANVTSSLSLLPHVGHGFRPDASQKLEMLAFVNQHLIGCGPTGVGDRERSDVALRFGLMQNYPNPFNPTTNIQYALPQSAASYDVALRVYDVLGREVRALVRGARNPGSYEVEFDATNLPSGVYLYKLTASSSTASFQQTRRLVLLR
jgi:acetyl esterase/lipase